VTTISSDHELTQFLHAGRAILDVRAPVEFHQGTAPGGVNHPLLNNDERAAVGTTYKLEGPEAAMNLGHRLIAGEVLEQRVKAWTDFFKINPDGAVMCFRGGQRSQLTQKELQRRGISIPRIDGGFKRVRSFLTDRLNSSCEEKKFRVLAGFTGSGKTEVLREIKDKPVFDLEKAARHRGSSFGTWSVEQPSPVDFENHLGLTASMWATHSGPIWTEDESRSIGRLVLPKKLFEVMQASPVFILERPRSERSERLTAEYLHENYGFIDGSTPTEPLSEKLRLDIRRALTNIERRLGGLETRNLLLLTEEAMTRFSKNGRFEEHWAWVEILLEKYYDPLYEYHLSKISDRVIGQGPVEEFLALANT